MTGPVDEAIWLTPAAHSGFVAELEQLTRSNPVPPPEVEGRIRELKGILRRADVADKPDDGLVEPGMTITVVFDGDPTTTTFLLAVRGIADTDPDIGLDVYPPASALGEAIAGKYPGDVFHYRSPSGVDVSGRILGAEPFRGAGLGYSAGR